MTVRESVLVTSTDRSADRSAIGVDRTRAEVTAEAAHGALIDLRIDLERDDPQTLWWLLHQAPVHGAPSLSPAQVGGVRRTSQAPPVSLHVTRLDVDTYLDRGRGLFVLTNDCSAPAPTDSDVLLRAAADSALPELAFPSGQDYPVTFVGTDNAYLTSAGPNQYRDIITDQELETIDCPELVSVVCALVHLDRVIVLGEEPVACYLTE